MEIKSLLLMKPFGHKSGLVFINDAIRVFFDPEHPFAANGVPVGRERDKRPSLIL